MPAATAALCQQPLGERLAVNTIADMRAILLGDWALCSGPGIFSHAQAGISINPNDRWAYTVWSGDQLTALTGLDNEGSIEYIDTSEANGRPTIQVNFVNDAGWTAITNPIISDQPRMMVIASDPAASTIYLPVGQTGAGVGADGGTGGAGGSGCGRRRHQPCRHHARGGGGAVPATPWRGSRGQQRRRYAGHPPWGLGSLLG